jgi:alanine-glyoxylate transaminase/(R)-3-amino-2-methylpropionate-pyruvate transaminase
MGARLTAGLVRLMQRHEVIGDVRGLGLMLGVELVTDRAAKTPARDLATEVLERTKELGLLIGRGGLSGNVLRIKPPLCITDEDVEFALEALDRALSRTG